MKYIQDVTSNKVIGGFHGRICFDFYAGQPDLLEAKR